MGIIHRLPQSEIQKIAAGEVVERPANVVKELIENALDAQATQITIVVHEGGKKLIQVIDNGRGMDAADARACFEHHATSKISSVHDLAEIATLGFRGEALSSIAAVSNVTLLTKQAAAPLGTQVELEAGEIKSVQDIACADGTSITVRDLLFNVPARRKFLRTTETESRAIMQVVQAFCVAYPQVHFSYTHELPNEAGRPLPVGVQRSAGSGGSHPHGYQLICSPTASRANRVAQLWPISTVPRLVDLEETDLITGVISDHSYSRFDRSWFFFFVNGRWIKNFTLGRAVVNGFAGVLPSGKYPVAVVCLTVPPESVDINVHPRKEELVFVNPRKIEHGITQAVKRALEQSLSTTLQASKTGWKETEGLPVWQSKTGQAPLRSQDRVTSGISVDQSVDMILDREPFALPTDPPLSQVPRYENIVRAPVPAVSAPPLVGARPVPAASVASLFDHTERYQLVGQLHKTYLLLEHEEGLLLIDQHAAHERVLYERFDTKFSQTSSTTLLFPTIVELSVQDITALTPHLGLLENYGFTLDVVGAQQVAVTATPIICKDLNLSELLRALVNAALTVQGLDTQSIQRLVEEKLRAQMACKTAVKAGDVLTETQMQQLLTDLYATPNRFSCPHGRPTSWLLAQHEIEKKFKRDYRS